jgi:hypothetical protein
MAGQSIWVSIALHELNGSVTSTSMSMSSISQQWQHDRMGWFTITAPNPLVVQQQHTPGQAMDEGDPTAPASQSAAATLIAKRGGS